jgi:hypothetical protein
MAGDAEILALRDFWQRLQGIDRPRIEHIVKRRQLFKLR